MRLHKQQSGFTLIELALIVVVIGVLLTLVLTTYSGVQAKNRNSSRQAKIDTLQAQLETYYVQFSKYPTSKNLNDPSWRKANLKDIANDALQDPRWKNSNTACTANGAAITSSTPAPNCLSYQVTTSEGADCDNIKKLCAQYTLTAKLEGSGKYVKSSLN